MPNDTLLLLCTCPDLKCAEAIAGHLLERRLAACVSVVAGVTSLYRWQGRIERSNEVQLLIKSRRQHYPALEQAICDLHPYELPEILAVSVEQGLPGYLDWIRECTQSDA